MEPREERPLSTLEYIVLGLISEAPQSGYSIIATLENGTQRRWTASPGSIYPILKRLEKEKYITGELEQVYETRPRKMYTLAPTGEQAMREWILAPLTWDEVLNDREIVLIKFLFAEKFLARDEVTAWLDRYEEQTTTYDGPKRLFYQTLINASTLHQQLIYELTLLDLNMQRTWIQMARRRLEAEPPRPAD